MTQKIAISLPDELYGRLQKVKDRFNVSGVCQAAITDEVSRQEAALVLEEEMESVYYKYKKLTAQTQ